MFVSFCKEKYSRINLLFQVKNKKYTLVSLEGDRKSLVVFGLPLPLYWMPVLRCLWKDAI